MYLFSLIIKSGFFCQVYLCYFSLVDFIIKLTHSLRIHYPISIWCRKLENIVLLGNSLFIKLVKYNSGNKINGIEIGGAYGSYKWEEKCIEVFGGEI
jgi:hypothetical protein